MVDVFLMYYIVHIHANHVLNEFLYHFPLCSENFLYKLLSGTQLMCIWSGYIFLKLQHLFSLVSLCILLCRQWSAPCIILSVQRRCSSNHYGSPTISLLEVEAHLLSFQCRGTLESFYRALMVWIKMELSDFSFSFGFSSLWFYFSFNYKVP